ncbi:mCG142064 [Mus musculus]|nr:mCG142064 [Mus musculus]
MTAKGRRVSSSCSMLGHRTEPQLKGRGRSCLWPLNRCAAAFPSCAPAIFGATPRRCSPGHRSGLCNRDHCRLYCQYPWRRLPSDPTSQSYNHWNISQYTGPWSFIHGARGSYLRFSTSLSKRTNCV